MVDSINIVFPEAYEPLLEVIDEACRTCGISRAGLIRSLVCDTFEFTPKRPMKSYRSKFLRVKQ